MELTLNRGVLGQYDTGSNLRYKGKEKYVDKFFEYIAGAIAIIGAVILFFSCLGACMGCKSVLNCYDGCSCSCARYIVQSCYEAGEGCREGCGCSSSGCSSSSSSHGCSPSSTRTVATYKALNNVTGTYDYWYVSTYHYGCKNTGKTTDTEFALDTTYWSLDGIYSDAAFKKSVKVEQMKEDKLYYTKWSEINYGQEVNISFSISNNAKNYANQLPTVDPAIIGSDSVDWGYILDNIPDLENYLFKGIYLNGIMIVNENKRLLYSGLDGEFHLYNWDVIPGQSIKLEIRYEGLPITITIWDLDTETVLYSGTDFGYGSTAYEVIFDNELSDALESFLQNREIDTFKIGNNVYTSRTDLIEISLTAPLNIYLTSHRKYVSFAVYYGDPNDTIETLYSSSSIDYGSTYGQVINDGKNFESWFTKDYIVIGYSTETSNTNIYSSYNDIKNLEITDDVALYAVARKKNYNFVVYDDSMYQNKLINLSVAYNSSYGEIITNNMPISFTNSHYILGYALAPYETDLTKIFTIEMLSIKPVESDVYLYVIVAETTTIKFVVGNSHYYKDLPIVSNYQIPDIDKAYQVQGFEFDGWYSDSSYSSTRYSTMSQVVNNNISVLYAKLQGQSYTIYFYDGVDKLVAKNHEQYTASADPYILKDGTQLITIPAGYTFAGWKVKDDETNTKVTQIDPYDSGNKSFEAILTPLKFTMYINVPVGGSISPKDKQQTWDFNSIPDLPEPDLDDGYEFIGYYYNTANNKSIKLTDENGVFVSEFNYLLFQMTYNEFRAYCIDAEQSSMIDIVARVALKEFDVTLKVNDVELSKQSIKYGNFAVYNEYIQREKGYQFKGWNEDRYATTGKDLSQLSITKETTLYAIFTLYPIVINYVDFIDKQISHSNLPESGSTIEYGTKKGTTALSVVTNYSNNPKYEFEGWYYGQTKVSDNTGKLLIDFTDTNLGIDYDEFITTGITLEADSKEREFTIKYYIDNTQIGDDTIVKYGNTIEEPSVPSVPQGYSFQYWKYNNERYYFNQGVTDNMTLYAYYTPNKYLVTLDIQSFEESSLVKINNKTTDTVLLTYDGNIGLPQPSYSGSKYDFIGYYYNGIQVATPNGEGKFKFNMSNLNVLGITDISQLGEPEQLGGITLTATFKLKTFTIEYYTDNIIYDTIVVDYGTQAQKPLTNPSRDNMRFVGWSTQKNPTSASPLYQFTGSQVTGNLKLYAVFSNKVNVTLYDIDGTTLLDSFELTYGSKLSISSNYYTNYGIIAWTIQGSTAIVAEWDSIDKEYWVFSIPSVQNITDDLVLVAKSK